MEWFDTVRSESPGDSMSETEENQSEETECPDLILQNDVRSLLDCLGCNGDHTAVDTLRTLRGLCEQNEGARGHLGPTGAVFLFKMVQRSHTEDVKEEVLLTICTILDKDQSAKNSLSTSEVFRWVHVKLSSVLQTMTSDSLEKTAAEESMDALLNPTGFLLNLVHFVSVLTANNSVSQRLLREQECLNDLTKFYRLGFPHYLSDATVSTTSHPFLTLWQTVSAALCFAVNNPRNEENQEHCLCLLPFLVRQLRMSYVSLIRRSLCHLLAQSLACNTKVQNAFSFAGGLHALALHCLTTWTGEDLLSALDALDAAVTDHENNAAVAGSLHIPGLLLTLIDNEQSSVVLKTKSALALSHCADACDSNRIYLQNHEGLVNSLRQMISAGDPDLEAVSKYLVCLAVQGENSDSPLDLDTPCRRRLDFDTFKVPIKPAPRRSSSASVMDRTHLFKRSESMHEYPGSKQGSNLYSHLIGRDSYSSCDNLRLDFGKPGTMSPALTSNRISTFSSKRLTGREVYGSDAESNAKLSVHSTGFKLTPFGKRNNWKRTASPDGGASSAHASRTYSFKQSGSRRESGQKSKQSLSEGGGDTNWNIGCNRNTSDYSELQDGLGHDKHPSFRSQTSADGSSALLTPIQLSDSLKMIQQYADILKLQHDMLTNQMEENNKLVPDKSPADAERAHRTDSNPISLQKPNAYQLPSDCFEFNSDVLSSGVHVAMSAGQRKPSFEQTIPSSTVGASRPTANPQEMDPHFRELHNKFLTDILRKSTSKVPEKASLPVESSEFVSWLQGPSLAAQFISTPKKTRRIPKSKLERTFSKQNENCPFLVDANDSARDIPKPRNDPNKTTLMSGVESRKDSNTSTDIIQNRADLQHSLTRGVQQKDCTVDRHRGCTCSRGCEPCCCSIRPAELNFSKETEHKSGTRLWSHAVKKKFKKSRHRKSVFDKKFDTSTRNSGMAMQGIASKSVGFDFEGNNTCPGCKSSSTCDLPLLHSRNLWQVVSESWEMNCLGHRVLHAIKEQCSIVR